MRRQVLLPLAMTMLAAACASPPTGTGSGAASSSPSSAPAENQLRIVVDPGNGDPPRTYTLTCGAVPGGDHPDPAAACAQLQKMGQPFAPLPAHVACTQIYSGPQTGRITGVWHGRAVNISLARTDGCRTTQWDSFGPVLPTT